MLTRRNFLKLTGISTLAWYVGTSAGWAQRALAQIPGGTLDPLSVPKYATPLLIPPVMPRAVTSPTRAASRWTTTRSRCGSSPSRSCLRAARHHGLGVRRGGVGEQKRAAGP